MAVGQRPDPILGDPSASHKEHHPAQKNPVFCFKKSPPLLLPFVSDQLRELPPKLDIKNVEVIIGEIEQEQARGLRCQDSAEKCKRSSWQGACLRARAPHGAQPSLSPGIRKEQPPVWYSWKQTCGRAGRDCLWIQVKRSSRGGSGNSIPPTQAPSLVEREAERLV